MSQLNQQHVHYQKVKRVIEWLTTQYQSQPNLDNMAQAVGMSPFHLQRTFTQWAGVSPKQFIGFLTKEHAKSRLHQSTVMDAALASGLSGGGRLYDLMVSCDAVTPGEFKSGGAGMVIEYGIHKTPFGHGLLATTQRGVCHLSFFDSEHETGQHTAELNASWPKAKIIESPKTTGALIRTIFGTQSKSSISIKVLLNGTAFKMKVWEALLKIPPGSLSSYQQVASAINQPNATRAVASAIANNHIAYLIPCHRVIRSTGVLNAYRWGQDRKAALIGWESAQNL